MNESLKSSPWNRDTLGLMYTFLQKWFLYFCVFGETTFTCFYLYVNDLALISVDCLWERDFCPYPFNGCKSKPWRCVEKYYSVRGVLLSGRGAGLFRTVFHILIKVARTNNGLKGTYILKACSFYQQGQLILVLLRVWCKSEQRVESMLLILPRMWPLLALFMAAGFCNMLSCPRKS